MLSIYSILPTLLILFIYITNIIFFIVSPLMYEELATTIAKRGVSIDHSILYVISMCEVICNMMIVCYTTTNKGAFRTNLWNSHFSTFTTRYC